MQDDRQLEAYRRMTPAERWQIWLELSDLGISLWEANLSPSEIERRWTVWRREHELSDQNMLRGFKEAS